MKRESRVLSRLAMLVEIPFVFGKAALRYRKAIVSILRRFLISLLERYRPVEAFQNGLLDPDRPISVFSRFASRSRMVEVERRLNPSSWAPLLEDKGIFYRYCMSAGIPIPELLALFLKRTAGWTSAGRPISGRENWCRFFLEQCPPEFVVKPSRSAYGKGMRVIRREDGEFVDSSGFRYSPEALYESLVLNPDFESFVIQKRVYNHPELQRLSGAEGLQTFRIVTVVDIHGRVQLASASLKIIVGNNVFDNHCHGLSGNLLAEISPTDGSIVGVRHDTVDGSGMQEVACHPVTGIRFIGFRIPSWDRICATIRRVVPEFLPIRTIGWDVALTPDDLVFIEGNIWYDPPVENGRMGEMLATMSDTISDCEGTRADPIRVAAARDNALSLRRPRAAFSGTTI
jgi:hypothetical protein